jgi:hypothetical protein
VQNLQAPVALAEHPAVLQHLHRCGHGRSLRAQYLRQEVLGHVEHVAPDHVRRGEQPPTEALEHWMKAVAERGLGHLTQLVLGAAEQ